MSELSALTRMTDLHIFGDKQADINWENAEVRQELYKMLHWWLERGLDGFRVRFSQPCSFFLLLEMGCAS